MQDLIQVAGLSHMYGFCGLYGGIVNIISYGMVWYGIAWYCIQVRINIFLWECLGAFWSDLKRKRLNAFRAMQAGQHMV